MTLHANLLNLLSQPAIDQLATLEAGLASDRMIAVEYGPVAWLRSRLAQIAAGVAARTNAKNPRADQLVRIGASGGVSIDNQDFVLGLVLGTGVQPVSGVRWLFPNAQSSRLFLRPAAGASRRAVERDVTARLDAAGISGATLSVGGAG